MKTLRFLIAAATLVFSVAQIAALAQTPPQAPPAPVPSAILSAKKLFVSNGGPGFALPKHDPNDAFNRFYASLKGSNQFELVDDPADADLVLELKVPTLERLGISTVLTIYDRKSHYVLWTLRQDSEACTLVSTCDRNVAAVPASLVASFLALAGKASAASH